MIYFFFELGEIKLTCLLTYLESLYLLNTWIPFDLRSRMICKNQPREVKYKTTLVWVINVNFYIGQISCTVKRFMSSNYFCLFNYLPKYGIFITLHKKWSFPLIISSVNVPKSPGNNGFGHIYWKNAQWKTSYFEQCQNIFYMVCRCAFRMLSNIYVEIFKKIVHCVKSVRIRSYPGLYFPAFGLNTEDTKFLSRFSPNAGKYGPE